MKLAIAHRDRLIREALRRTLSKGHYELIWQATDRAQMEHDCRCQPTDLLLVELQLLGPKAQALPRLLESGVAVIALAPSNAVGDGYEALGLGALGLLEPPTLDDSGELIGAQRSLTRIDRLAKLVGSSHLAPSSAAPATTGHTRIIALGASTGGPLALAKVLGSLPADLDAAVLIVQHIETEFTTGLAEWLGSQCALPVTVATRGDTPKVGRVYLAGSGGHLVLLPSFQFGHQMARATELHVPSVDALFSSVALHAAPSAAALLTGMGSDGVAGLGALHRAGWLTLAQDERTSVVYGMPRAAVEAGVVQQILDIAQIGPVLVRHVNKARRS
ncbi:MAG: chemotaxis protein CheB [Pseudomarimonas sp.]